MSSRTGPGPPPAHYTSTAALRKFPQTSQIQTNPTVVTWQIRNLTVSGRAGRPEPAARGRAPVEGPSLHSPTQWSPTEERRLVAEEGSYSKKTWPRKNEDGRGGRAPAQGPSPSSTSDLSDRPTSDRHPTSTSIVADTPTSTSKMADTPTSISIKADPTTSISIKAHPTTSISIMADRAYRNTLGQKAAGLPQIGRASCRERV